MVFEGKVALVTGSSRGIGSVIARKFATSGADVTINYRAAGGSSEEQANRLAHEIEELGRRALVARADISQRPEVESLFTRVREDFGRLDFLILNAARAPLKPFARLLERDLRQLVDTNFVGNILCIRNALPLLESAGGSVVFVSSLGSRHSIPDYPLGSMKAAMEAVVRDSSESLRERGVRVNAVCGGMVRTDSLKVLRQSWPGLESIPEELFVTADEIADAVEFLCSSAGQGIQGQVIVVDRGLGHRIHISE